MYFLAIFGLFWDPPGGFSFWALGPYFPPLGPYFPYPLLALSGNYPQWEDVRDVFQDRFQDQSHFVEACQTAPEVLLLGIIPRIGINHSIPRIGEIGE